MTTSRNAACASSMLPAPAFATSPLTLPVRTARHRPRVCALHLRPFSSSASRRHARDTHAHSSRASSSRAGDAGNGPEKNVWNGVRRVVRTSALSLSVLFAAVFPNGVLTARPSWAGTLAQQQQQQQQKQHANGPHMSVRRDASTASDVEAAAVTLGAVTVGGLVMRAVLNSRRDEDEERARLMKECARLEQEELERARRIKRTQMESLEEDTSLADQQLLQSFMKRVSRIEGNEDAGVGGDDEGVENDNSASANGKKHMRHSPIPDRGTGSMLLDRPEHNNEDGDDLLAGNANAGQPNPEELDMLNRMWNLNSHENEDNKNNS